MCVLGGDWRFPGEGGPAVGKGKRRATDEGMNGAGGKNQVQISEPVKHIVRACLTVEPTERPDVDTLLSMVEDVIANMPDEGEGSIDPDED